MPEKRNLQVKRKPRIKFLIAAMGPGETIQGIGLASYLSKTMGNVVFVVREKKNLPFLDKQKKKFQIFLAETSEKFKKIFEREKPNVFVLCNSKMITYYKDFLTSPLLEPVTVSLDSNWLFSKGEKWYSFTDWLNKYLILFPKEIFNLGLKKYGGNYIIAGQVMKKIETVGFIPSWQKISPKLRRNIRKRYKIDKDAKMIFAYFGGFGAGFRDWALKNLIKAAENLIRQGLKIGIVYVGPTKNLNFKVPKKSWLVGIKRTTENNFFSLLSSADLVFQHQGIGTLAQAISARVPVIANVRDLKDESYPRHAHAWEIAPFVKLNLCKMFYRSTPIEEIQKGIEKLLYDKKEIKKMKKAQTKYYQPGEVKAYKIMMDLLKTKRLQTK